MISNTTPPPATTPKRPADTDLEASPRSGMISRVIGFFSSAKKRRKTETLENAAAEISTSSTARRKDFGQEAPLPYSVSTVSSPNAEHTEKFIDALSYPSTSPANESESFDISQKSSGFLGSSKGADVKFDIGSSSTPSVLRSSRKKTRSGLTQSSFRKARFSSGTKFYSRQGSHTPNTANASEVGFGGNGISASGVYYKGTPYRRQKLQFQTSSDINVNNNPNRDAVADTSNAATTPTGSFQPKKKYATTPYHIKNIRNPDQMQTRLSSSESTPVSKSSIKTPSRSLNRTFQKRYKPASNTLLSAATPSSFTKKYYSKSKLRMGSTPKLALANSQKNIIIKQLAKQTSAINSLRSPSSALTGANGNNDGGLFRDPSISTGSKIQRVGMRRVLGSNQDGGRLMLGNSMDHRNRKGSSTRGAFTGEARSGNNYWNDTTVDANTAKQSNSAATNGSLFLGNQNDIATTPNKDQNLSIQEDAADDIVQPIKRSKVTFDRTPPGQKMPLGSDIAKEKSTPVDVRPIRKVPTQYKPPPSEKKYVTCDGSRHGATHEKWNHDGNIEYGSEEVYGTTFDYSIFLEDSFPGVEVCDATDTVMRRKMVTMRYSFKARSVGVETAEESGSAIKDASSASSAVPFSFMPKDTGSSRKGSSSILNKSLDSAKKESKYSASVGESVSSSKPASTSLGWGDMFALKPGEWKCDVCSVTNPKHAVTCLSCEAAKPGIRNNANGPTVTSNGDGSAPKFSFGAPTAASKDATATATGSAPKFSFGAPTAASNDATATATGSAPKFSFGAPTAASKDATATATATGSAPKFSFGAPTAASKSPTAATSTFSFGAPKDDETKPETSSKSTLGNLPASKKDASKPPEAGFTFGAVNSSKDKKTGEAKETSSAPSFSFGEKSKMSSTESTKSTDGSAKQTSSFSFGTSAPTESKDRAPAFQFGSKASDAPKPAVTFGSIPSTAKTDVAVPIPLTAMGSSSETDVNPPTQKKRSLNNDDGPKSSTAPKFSFGGASSSETAAPTPAFSFGASKDSGDSSKTASKSTFAFGSGTTSAAPSSTAPSSTAFTFGTSTSTPAPANPAQSSSLAPASTSGAPSFTFGSSSTPAPATVAPPSTNFTFGSSAPAPTPNEPVPSANAGPSFSFGSLPPAPAPASGGFSFGQQPSSNGASTQQSTSGSTFTFGSTPAPSAPSANVASFTFGASTNAPAPMAFGSSSAPSVAPAFGVAPPASAAPAFGFGQQAPVAAPTPPPPAFGFGAPTPAAQPTQFGAPSPAPVAPNFGGSAAPTGGGFNIGTGGGSKSTRGRRIVRARRPPSNK